MSLQEAVDNVRTRISDAYSALAEYDAPEQEIDDTYHMPSAIRAIPKYDLPLVQRTLESYVNSRISVIGEFAFCEASTLSSIECGNVQAISRYAFSGCGIKIAVFDAATDVDQTAFEDCTGLQYVQFAALRSTSLMFARAAALTAASFDSLESISPNMFSGCAALKSVYAPQAVTIGASAFYQCTKLESAECPHAEEIGSGAFSSCAALQAAAFPVAAIIYQTAFQNCTSLQFASFQAATTIGSSAFQGCSYISYGYFPECTVVNQAAFSSCSRMQQIEMPVVKTVGNNAFYKCSSLVQAVFPECTSIGNSNTFSGCSRLEVLSIPKVETIPQQFGNNLAGLQQLYLNAAAGISSDTFASCANLVYVKFDNCSSFYSGSKNTNPAFDGCTALLTIDFGDYSSNTVPNLPFSTSNSSYYPFAGAPSSCRVVVPDSMYESWIASSGWTGRFTSSRIIRKSNS